MDPTPFSGDATTPACLLGGGGSWKQLMTHRGKHERRNRMGGIRANHCPQLRDPAGNNYMETHSAGRNSPSKFKRFADVRLAGPAGCAHIWVSKRGPACPPRLVSLCPAKAIGLLRSPGRRFASCEGSTGRRVSPEACEDHYLGGGVEKLVFFCYRGEVRGILERGRCSLLVTVLLEVRSLRSLPA